jgi:pyruvate dehydrogenase E1 component
VVSAGGAGQSRKPDGSSAYLRLSTRPVDQKLAAVPADPAARERRRRQAVAGGYALRRTAKAAVTIAVMEAMVPEALAADRLTAQGFPADVICVTSLDLLFRAIQARRGLAEDPGWILGQIFPAERATRLVTLLDGHPDAGVPRHGQQRAGHRARRQPLRPVLGHRRRLPLSRH